MAFDPSRFTTTKAKPLPVYLLLDVSTTMGEIVDPENAEPTGETFFKDGKQWEVVEGGTSKMDQLNNAVQRMLDTFIAEEQMDSEIHVAVITFGDQAELRIPLTTASKVEWTDLTANGETFMGAAFTMAKAMIEDKQTTPSRAYRPVVVLVSDGQPNDDWQAPLESLISEGRSAKCDRMAMAVGADADKGILTQFIANTPHQLFHADDASRIHEFFERLTMSVTTRFRSKNPNQIPSDADINLDGTSVPSPEGAADEADEDDGYW